MIDISTYLNRITSEHKTKPKFMGLVAARLQPLIDLFECLEQIDNAFDLDTAEGKQLDIIGEYIGVSRLLNFQPEYAGAVLADPYYRMLLKAQISLNNWDGTIEGIKRIWGDIFPEYEIQIVDNQDMTMEVRIIGLRQLFESELVQHGYITPKPMGVDINYTVVMSIEVNAGLFLGALTENVITRDTQGKSPPDEISADPAEIFAQSVRVADNITVMTQGKPPPENPLTVIAAEYAGALPIMQIRASEAKAKAITADIDPPLLDEYSSAAVVASVIRNSTIRSKVRS